MYIGISDVAHSIKKAYLGVDGVARAVKKIYIGVDGIARLVWSAWNGELYSAGNEFTDVTGGWKATTQKLTGNVEGYGVTGKAPTITRNADSMTIYLSGNIVSGSVRTANMIDLTDFSTISITCEMAGTHPYERLFVMDNSTGDYGGATKYVQIKDGTQTLDISALSGKYYVGLGLYTSGALEFDMISCIMS